jgi:transcriptional regulator with XRE-family HTH domain
LIVDNIQRLCREKGTTLCEVERKTGLGNGVIARWKDSNPRVDRLAAVAEYFGVTLDDLLRDNAMNETER